MKNPISKTIGTMLAILMLTVFTQISLSAQDIVNGEKGDELTLEDSSAQRRNARALEGVWNVQITRRNCQTGMAIGTGQAMLTYIRGGTMHEYGAGRPPSTRGSGHGVWSFNSNRQFTTAFQFFIFQSDGTLGGRMIVRQQIQVGRDKNRWTEITTTQVLDIDGNVIMNGCATGIATRFE